MRPLFFYNIHLAEVYVRNVNIKITDILKTSQMFYCRYSQIYLTTVPLVYTHVKYIFTKEKHIRIH